MVDLINEFLVEFKTRIKAEYNVKKAYFFQKPQANSRLQKFYETIGNITLSFKAQDMVLDDEKCWDGILAATMFAMCATMHNTTLYFPAQSVSERDALQKTHHRANWHLIKKCEQDLINKKQVTKLQHVQ